MFTQPWLVGRAQGQWGGRRAASCGLAWCPPQDQGPEELGLGQHDVGEIGNIEMLCKIKHSCAVDQWGLFRNDPRPKGMLMINGGQSDQGRPKSKAYVRFSLNLCQDYPVIVQFVSRPQPKGVGTYSKQHGLANGQVAMPCPVLSPGVPVPRSLSLGPHSI